MTLLVWPVPNLGEPRLIRNDSRKDFTAIAFHPSGRHLYVASNDATVHVFETATWERIGRFTLANRQAESARGQRGWDAGRGRR